MRINQEYVEAKYEIAKNHSEAISIALQIAKEHTGRKKILLLYGDPDHDWETKSLPSYQKLPGRNAAELCRAIGESTERFAAFVIKSSGVRDYEFKRYTKRVRELASAEGALLIWDDSKQDLSDAHRQDREWVGVRPDILCQRLNETTSIVQPLAGLELWPTALSGRINAIQKN